MNEPIRIWIVEDDPDWLRGLAAYLNGQPDLAVTARFGTPETVRQRMASGPYDADVVLMDIMLQDRPEGVVLAEEAALATGARVIMLTSMEEKDLIFRAFQAGAIDYQVKASFENLPEAIRAAFRKAAPISPAAAEKLREEFRRLRNLEREFQAKEVKSLVTASELQLLHMVDQGYTQSQIADKLVISIRTVKNHIGNVLKKLGLSSSKEAADKLKQLGVLPSDKDEQRHQR